MNANPEPSTPQFPNVSHFKPLEEKSKSPNFRPLNLVTETPKLRYMHLHGVVHSDVKPENVYMSPSGLLKLGDFGLVRDVEAGAGSDDGEDGDRRYLALEALSPGADLQVEEEIRAYTHPCIDACSLLSCFADTCTQAADMFALGATAYELASASRLPETGPDYAAIRASPQAPASLPPELGALIKALMDPDPSQRPTARQVLDNEALISMVMLPGPQPWARDTIPVQYVVCLVRMCTTE